MSVHVMLVGESRLMLEGLSRALHAHPPFEVVGTEHVSELEGAGVSPRPAEIVVLELSARLTGAVSLLDEVRRRFPQSRILVVLKGANALFLRSILEAGVLSCVQDDQTFEELVHALESTAEGQSYLSPRLSRQLLSNVLSTLEKSPIERLSPRERTVLLLLLQGRSNKEIAVRLGLSVRTVETHRAHVMNKLGVHSIAELFQFAIKHELIVETAASEQVAGNA